jgi:hypothetical protein
MIYLKVFAFKYKLSSPLFSQSAIYLMDSEAFGILFRRTNIAEWLRALFATGRAPAFWELRYRLQGEDIP